MARWIDRLKIFLAEPATRGLDIDAPVTTELRRRIVREKRLLRDVYHEWYRFLIEQLPPGDRPVLELGSGAGFFKEYLPDVLTSDVVPATGVDRIIDAHDMPFEDQSLRAIVMVDVLHHLCAPRKFFSEAARCLVPGGKIIMVEPWKSILSSVVWGKLHHEPFRPSAETWEFPTSGPLSGANGALPWILFHRDREQFAAEFPEFRIDVLRPATFLRYPLSGGVSMRSLVPGWTAPAWRAVDVMASPANRWLSLFARIALVRLPEPAHASRRCA
jgi:SAM-dependent methyltransferase